MIAVRPEHRRRRLGASMLRHALTALHGQYPVLKFGVAVGNSAEDFYRSLGFLASPTQHVMVCPAGPPSELALDIPPQPSTSGAGIDYRELSLEEVDRIREIDVTETGDVIYKWADGRVAPVPERWERSSRPAEEWGALASWIRRPMGKGGLAVGAIADGRLVGFASLQFRLADDVAWLQALWVSRSHRRRGVATRLVQRVLEGARREGARSVYVSATPSQSAQEFYRRQGFRPSTWVHRELFQHEPEDIHMTLDLTHREAP